MCSCCGAGPRVDDEGDWWLIFQAGLCDEDGVYYGMLCDLPDGSGCLSMIREENARRQHTRRDKQATVITELLGDDLDGAQALMENLEGFDF